MKNPTQSKVARNLSGRSGNKNTLSSPSSSCIHGAHCLHCNCVTTHRTLKTKYQIREKGLGRGCLCRNSTTTAHHCTFQIFAASDSIVSYLVQYNVTCYSGLYGVFVCYIDRFIKRQDLSMGEIYFHSERLGFERDDKLVNHN